MISLLSDEKLISDFGRNGVFGARIYADYLSDAADLIWWDENELLLCLRNSVLSISGRISDPEELNAFVAVIRPAAVLCESDIAAAINGRIIQSGVIMRRKGEGETASLPEPDLGIVLRDYHDLLLECEMDCDYVGFCCETFKALKTGTGMLLDVFDDKQLIAALIANSVTPHSAIINAVAVKPKYQRKGLGRDLMTSANRLLSGRDIYILREDNKNEAFYTSCGYENTGRWCVIEPETK